jgi:hypothetical protein
MAFGIQTRGLLKASGVRDLEKAKDAIKRVPTLRGQSKMDYQCLALHLATPCSSFVNLCTLGRTLLQVLSQLIIIVGWELRLGRNGTVLVAT